MEKKKFQVYADIAASAQKVLEELLFSIFQYAYNLTKEKKFLFSGGVAMNSAAVRKCSKLKFINQLNISPSPGDSGAAIGASYFGFLNERKKKMIILYQKIISKIVFTLVNLNPKIIFWNLVLIK